MWNGYSAWAMRRTSGARKHYTTLEHVQYGLISSVILILCVIGLYWAVSTLVGFVAQVLR
jgi:hypothetical protein